MGRRVWPRWPPLYITGGPGTEEYSAAALHLNRLNMFKLVLLTCLLAVALAYPHHASGHHGVQHDEEKPAVPADKADAKPAEEEKPAAGEEKKPEEAEPIKEAEKEAEPSKAEPPKPEADVPKKDDAVAPPAEAHHHADAKPAKS